MSMGATPALRGRDALPRRPGRLLVRRGLLLLALWAAVLAALPAQAQTGLGPDLAPQMDNRSVTGPAQRATPAGPAARPRQDNNAPVTFTADSVEYDRDSGIVTARGNIEAWQGERVLRADEFTYNRNTGIATARGNVQLLEADGQVMFAEEAELNQGFKDGVLVAVRALLAANGRMVANGVRRTGGTVSEMSRVIYSSCDLCEQDPSRPPLWQVRARQAAQNRESQRITYRDAVVEFGGIPVLYTPYLSHPDPAAPRASGFLFPTMGMTRFLGPFITTPYYWVIDGTSDLMLLPTFSVRQYPNLAGEYRKLFNNGELQISASLGGFNGTDTPKRGIAGHIYAKGRFTLNDNWRVGFDINRGTNDLYLRTYRFDYRRVLTSQIYAEGFWGTEGYARIDARAYQALARTDDNRRQPYVLPNIFYEVAPYEQIAGGHLTVDAGLLGIYRQVGSTNLRLASRASWQRQEVGPLGDLWTFRMQADARGYTARGQDESPVLLRSANGEHAFGNIRAAVDWRMPFVRYAGQWGTQTIEPRIQLVTGPNTGRQTTSPNEDAIDFEFSDANLFALNRFTGRDRSEGGSRLDVALRGSWDFVNGGRVEGVVGRSFRTGDTTQFLPGSGLDRRSSDWVGRVSVSPVPWFDLTTRSRFDGENGALRMIDATARVSAGPLAFTAGYFRGPATPYLIPVDRPRNEVTGGVTARYENWRAGVLLRYNVEFDRPALLTGFAGYEDECFILEARFMRRFARDIGSQQNLIAGNTVLLIQMTLKTLGNYNFRAL